MDVLQAVLEASPNAVLIVDTDGVIRHANRMVPDVLGYGTDEIEGMVVEDLLIAEDRTDHVRFREEYMANPEPRPMGRELDLYARHKDGREVPVEISLAPSVGAVPAESSPRSRTSRNAASVNRNSSARTTASRSSPALSHTICGTR